MTTKLEHTSEPTASGFWIHALDCPACQEQDQAEARQANLDAEEGYRELRAMLARGEKVPETEAF